MLDIGCYSVPGGGCALRSPLRSGSEMTLGWALWLWPGSWSLYRAGLVMTTTIGMSLVPVADTFVFAEVALVGFLAGYRGTTRPGAPAQ
jgi:hypothetical protein